jgi:methylglutaconyl-CoA hydratase
MSDLFKLNKDARGVATLSMNRPEVHNAFNDEMIQALTQAFRELSQDESVRVVVLEGEGKSFCAGADLNWMKKMKDYSEQENYDDSVALSQLFYTIDTCSKPVVAKIHGAAIGGGVGLVSVCDYVVASENTKFGLTEVKLGLLPAVISPFVIAKIGESYARALFLSGERFDEKKALQLGLIHKISLERHFTQDVEKVVDRMIAAAPLAQSKAKELIREVVSRRSQNYTEVESYTCKLISGLRTGPEGQEGMSALLEKRTPNWIQQG